MIFHCSTLLHVCCLHSAARRIIPPRCTRQSGRRLWGLTLRVFNIFIVIQYYSLFISPVVIVDAHSPNEILRFRPAPEPTNSAGRPVSPIFRRAEQAELRLQPQEDGRDLQVQELLGQLIGYLL